MNFLKIAARIAWKSHHDEDYDEEDEAEAEAEADLADRLWDEFKEGIRDEKGNMIIDKDPQE
jgi:hypothetical protein